MANESKLRITLEKSVIGRPETQKKVVTALGLKRVNHTVEQFDTPIIRGMIEKVKHLVCVK